MRWRELLIDVAALSLIGCATFIDSNLRGLLCMALAAAWACWNYWIGLSRRPTKDTP